MTDDMKSLMNLIIQLNEQSNKLKNDIGSPQTAEEAVALSQVDMANVLQDLQYTLMTAKSKDIENSSEVLYASAAVEGFTAAIHILNAYVVEYLKNRDGKGNK